MTFEQLDYFIAAATCDTFFDAAESLHITQSTLSKQIMKLEKELDLQLLDRSHRSASLTEAGTYFLQEAITLSRQYHETLIRLKNFQQKENAALSVGTLPILSQYGLSSLPKDFTDHYPQIPLSLTETEDLELLKGLEDGTYDLIIARKNMADKKRHRFYPLVSDRLVVLLPKEHPLSSRSFLTLQDLAKEPLLLMPPHTSVYQLCCQLFEESGIAPNIIRTARMETIIGSVVAEGGISLLPEQNLKLFQPGNTLQIPLCTTPDLDVGILVNADYPLSSSLSLFLQLACSRKN